ncbi:MAG TPA: tRNA lysidine(34) synthetase TilS [Polyangiaceae bacterium]|nr:tRNA lysidine(34) synthetase TilS [Polyangiaceae bacterium]
MARSHPPTLLTLTRRTLLDECGVGRGEHLLVAVSGGGDSMALMHVLFRLGQRHGFRLSAHGVDHGLRQAARAELDLAEQFARSLAIGFTRSEVVVPPGGNLQARARTARYAALRSAANSLDCSRIATAHHADDRAETVIMRLLRGTSPTGLSVLPPRAGDLIRPCIRARRADIRAHLSRHSVPHVEDPSNANPRFLRTRVRHELLPLLEQLSPGIVGNLTALADEIGAGPAIELKDAHGQRVSLGRAQRYAVRRLLEGSSSAARIRIGADAEITLDLETGRLDVRSTSPTGPNASR